jgi:hypothetical protein
MIVALVAMFVGMGGTTYAVTKLPRRSVGSLQLKKGAVRKENIANGAVTVSKLRKGLIAAAPAGPSGPPGPSSPSVPSSPPAPVIVNPDVPPDPGTYAARAGWADKAGKADRATLADKATTATTAGHATSAGTATSAGSAANAGKLNGIDSSYFLTHDTVVDLPRFTLADGRTRVIFANGPFKYTARCEIDSAGTDYADILISSTENHSAFDGDQINPNLLTSSPENSRIHAHVEVATGEPAFKAEDDGTAVAPGGGEVRSTTWYVGINLFNATGRCYYGGFAIV